MLIVFLWLWVVLKVHTYVEKGFGERTGRIFFKKGHPEHDGGFSHIHFFPVFLLLLAFTTPRFLSFLKMFRTPIGGPCPFFLDGSDYESHCRFLELQRRTANASTNFFLLETTLSLSVSQSSLLPVCIPSSPPALLLLSHDLAALPHRLRRPLAPAALLLRRLQAGDDGLVEHVLEAVLGHGGALHVLERPAEQAAQL